MLEVESRLQGIESGLQAGQGSKTKYADGEVDRKIDACAVILVRRTRQDKTRQDKTPCLEDEDGWMEREEAGLQGGLSNVP